MKKMGMFIPEFPGQTHIFFWREIKALSDFDVNVEIISTRQGDMNKVNHDFAKTAYDMTFYLHPPQIDFLFYIILHPVWFMKALKYILKLDEGIFNKIKLSCLIIPSAGLLEYAEKNDLRHVHGHSCANVAHILAISSLTGKMSYSLTLHGGLSTYGANHKQKMESAAFIATVTKPLQLEVIQNTDLPIEKIPVISMGVDLEKFNYKNRIKNEKTPINFITVARLSQGKGHTFALQALERIKNNGFSFYYKIVGGGEYEDNIRSEVKERGLSDCVFLTGTLCEELVLEALYASDVLLLTSFGEFEAAPVCVMEAMASGIPTITSIIGGTQDMIKSNFDGILVEQKNVDQIESAMMKMINDQDLLYLMGKNARKSAVLKFDYRIQANKLISEITKAGRL